MQPLRDYQKTAVAEALEALKVSRSTLFVCPTGGGKTWVFAEIAARFRGHGRILVIADREQLVKQAADVLRARTRLRVGIEQGPKRVNRAALPDVVCATIQSMSRRMADFARDAFALVIIDEADLGVTESYAAVLGHFAVAKVFGCTATPDRSDGKTLGGTFEKVITPRYLGDLITRGFLSPQRRTLVRIESVTLSDLTTRNGDFSATDLERILIHEKALHEVVRPSIDLAGSRPSIVFASTVRHAEALAEVFNRYAPHSARVVHGGTKAAERADILSAYTAGKIRFLCSCALLLRGVDLPQTSCVVMARPTQSRSLYCQAIGRGTRLAPGKSDLLVLDFTDNSRTHSLVSPVDIIAPLSDEVRERAREIADEQAECDPQEAIAQAERELAADPELRQRITATVAYRLEAADYSPKLTENAIALLGTMSDVQLAAMLGMSTAGINKARRIRGIPRFVPLAKEHTIDWSKIPLWKLSNLQVYKLYGISPDVTERARALTSLPHKHDPVFQANGRAFTPLQSIIWDAVGLGTCDDRVLASQLGVLTKHVERERKARNIPDYCLAVNLDTLPLGSVPDNIIAANNGLHPKTVVAARRQKGIPPYCPR